MDGRIDKNYRAEIGRQVAEIRAKRGLSTRQLAELCGIDPSNVSKIERGKYNVSVDILGRVCEALGARMRIEEKEDTPRNHLGRHDCPEGYVPERGDVVVFDEDVIGVIDRVEDAWYKLACGVNTEIYYHVNGAPFLGFAPQGLKIHSEQIRPAAEEEELFLRYAFAETKASRMDGKVFDWQDFLDYCKSTYGNDSIQ